MHKALLESLVGREDGMTLVAVALLGMALMVTMMLLSMRVTASMNAAGLDRDYESAMFAAEAGLDLGLSTADQDPSYYTVMSSVDLSSRDAVLAAATVLAQDPSNLGTTPSGDFVIVMQAGSDVLYSVGASPSWDDPGRRTRVIEARIETIDSGTCWPEAALIANGLLEWGGGPVMTSPSSEHAAHAIGNGDFKGSSAIFIDGDIRVAGTVLNTLPTNLYGVMESGATPLNLPTTAELTAWQNDLLVEALAGGVVDTIDLSAPMTIQAPLHVSGDIFLRSGGALTIEGPGVVYVSGRVELGGDSTLYNGALLAVAGQFKQGGGTHYFLTGGVEGSGLVSFLGGTTDAIIFEGAATGMQGVIYAARGGIKLTGPAALYGAAIAGGPAPYGQLKSGGATSVTYPAGLVPASAWLPTVTGGPGGGCGLGASTWFADAAVMANGSVVFSGGSGTITSPSDTSAAHVLTNSTFKDATAWIDGDLTAGSTVTADPAKVAGTITSGAGSVVTFPPSFEIEAWRTELRLSAQSGTLHGPTTYESPTTLTAPAYFSGDLKVSGTTLTIQGPGVVYVAGKITVSGGSRVVNAGAVVAADLQIVFSGGSTFETAAEFEGGGDTFGTGIVSFAPGVDKALELSGGSQGTIHGIAYAPYGGIKLSGSSDWIGALIAGGTSEKGKAEVSGGGSVVFPVGMISASRFLPGHEEPEPPDTGITLVRRREL